MRFGSECGGIHSIDTGAGIFHAVGSAAMGSEDDDVAYAVAGCIPRPTGQVRGRGQLSRTRGSRNA
jgi:hypothetical protein